MSTEDNVATNVRTMPEHCARADDGRAANENPRLDKRARPQPDTAATQVEHAALYERVAADVQRRLRCAGRGGLRAADQPLRVEAGTNLNDHSARAALRGALATCQSTR